MNDFRKRKSVPAWRIVLYGLLAAGLLTGLGSILHDSGLYFAAGFAAVFVGVLGWALNLHTNYLQIHDVAERKQLANRYAKNALITLQTLAIPTALMGLVMLNDVFISKPEQEEAIVINKYESYAGKGGHRFWLEVKGQHTYSQDVGSWFYNKCSLNDTVKLSVTPLFKEWRYISLVRHGIVVARITPSNTYWLEGFGAASFLPLLLLDKFFREKICRRLSTSWIDKILGLYWFVVVGTELTATMLWIKYAGLLVGVFDSL